MNLFKKKKKEIEKINLKLKFDLNLKSILKWEYLTNKSYYDFDMNNYDEIKKLIYCIIISNNIKIKSTFEEFEVVFDINKKIQNEIMFKLNEEIKLFSQFINNDIKSNIENENKEDNKTYIKDIIALLAINCGLDINYIMNELKMYEINIYVNQYNEKIKRDFENDRLWSFMGNLANLDSKKVNNPMSYYPFPWDEKIEEKEEIMTLEDLEKEFENNKKIIEKINSK